MARLLTYDQYLNMLAEKSVDNTRQLKRSMTQRRNGMEDLYGICFSVNGDSGTPAKFYISLSPDYVYLQRFAFKFVIRPFTTTIKGAAESATVVVNNTSLEIDELTGEILPNPHTHTTVAHTHNIIKGSAFVPTTSTDWSIRIAGVDITPYLEEQFDTDPLFSGEGIYPADDSSDDINFYDILDVVSVMSAEGNMESEIDSLLAPGFKEVAIYSDAPFGVDAYLYLKYSNSNR